MKKTGIMTDSHSGIPEEAERLGIRVLPMPFYIGEKLYREGVDLSREKFYDMLRKGVDVSTSQPSPAEVIDMWKEMLKEYEEIVYIPLSSALSGSCMMHLPERYLSLIMAVWRHQCTVLSLTQ